ncbi:hypothetical protein [Prochlorococcus sp. MIT 1341]|uniref:hypothetical protein n=1 Tax=Prochlorococcus sp. MIT 1341 TaxID=3096221 RepID=UPI002A75296E|nr:hypothetical protein [Prochlorococcus sp. MIT 1341]
MAQLTIKVSAKADAMIAQLQKEIFNRRRKKVTAQGVVETLVESGAKSQSDKRYAASWKNLIKDIEKAAKQSEVHGNKPANITAEEWALILSHRTRKSAKPAPQKRAKSPKITTKKPAAKKATVKKVTKKTVGTKPTVKKAVVKNAPVKATAPRKARRARRAPTATATATAK